MPDYKKMCIYAMTYEELIEKYDLKPECLSSVGDGWVPLLDRCIQDLIALGWNREVGQIKKKFSALRFYIGSATDEMYARVSLAESESCKTCELCGDTGKRTGSGWIQTLCVNCADARKASKE